MKNLFIIFLFLFAVTITAVAQEQIPEPKDWIRKAAGIPIIAGVDWRWWGYYHPEDVKKMADSGGVDIINLDIYHTNPQWQTDTLKLFGLKGMPIRSIGYNWIQHYTDARYSVWEAEGNNNFDVNLEYDVSKMEEKNSGDTLKYIKLKPSAANLQNIELIKGPYYSQDVKYLASQDNILQIIRYRPEFRLKLEYNPYNPPVEDNPEDTICIIQITHSTYLGGEFLNCTEIIKERAITRGDFLQLNTFQNFLLHNILDSAYYTLENISCDSPVSEPLSQYTYHSYFSSDTLVPGPRSIKSYIQFKVIWKGKSQYLLSIDKVTVSDERGRRMFITDTTQVKLDILNQANSLNAYGPDSLLVGWLGIDEPSSIDIFEPIRIVTQILDDNSQLKQPLWLAWMGRWDGAWESRSNPFGAQGESPWKEFKKRVGKANIIQNIYMFDSPCSPTSPLSHSVCWTGEDYRSINIWRTALLNYKQAYELDPFFGVSIQCGAVKNTQANQRNVNRYDVLY